MSTTNASTTGSLVRGRAITVPALSAVGALALLVSLLGSTFLSLGGNAGVSFADLRTATRPAVAPGLQHAYFGWLAWTLVILVLVGLVAVSVVKHVAVIGAVIALSVLGVVLTLGCVKELDVEDPSGGFVTHFSWIRIGGYLHVVGFVLAIAACILALRSARRSAQ